MGKIICLYGGPGCGKSTTCAGLYYEMKRRGINCEMNREYIKEWIWEDRNVQAGDQSYFFAKQARKERVYIAKGLEYIITDSPLILTHFYGLKNDVFEQKYNTSLQMLRNHHGFCVDNGYKTDHFLLERTTPYTEAGRFQDEEQAKVCDVEIKDLLDRFGIRYNTVKSDIDCVDSILRELGIV